MKNPPLDSPEGDFLCKPYDKCYCKTTVTNVCKDFAVHKAHKFAADEQSKTASLNVLGVCSSVETLKYLRQVGNCNGAACVYDRYQLTAVHLLQFKRDAPAALDRFTPLSTTVTVNLSARRKSVSSAAGSLLSSTIRISIIQTPFTFAMPISSFSPPSSLMRVPFSTTGVFTPSRKML